MHDAMLSSAAKQPIGGRQTSQRRQMPRRRKNRAAGLHATLCAASAGTRRRVWEGRRRQHDSINRNASRETYPSLQLLRDPPAPIRRGRARLFDGRARLTFAPVVLGAVGGCLSHAQLVRVAASRPSVSIQPTRIGAEGKRSFVSSLTRRRWWRSLYAGHRAVTTFSPTSCSTLPHRSREVLAADCLLCLICSLDVGSASETRRGTKAKIPGVPYLNRGQVRKTVVRVWRLPIHTTSRGTPAPM